LNFFFPKKWRFLKAVLELTAAGTAPKFHRIPFSFRPRAKTKAGAKVEISFEKTIS